MELTKRHELCTLTCIPGPNAQLKLGSWKKDNSWSSSSSPGWQTLESKKLCKYLLQFDKRGSWFHNYNGEQFSLKTDRQETWDWKSVTASEILFQAQCIANVIDVWVLLRYHNIPPLPLLSDQLLPSFRTQSFPWSNFQPPTTGKASNHKLQPPPWSYYLFVCPCTDIYSLRLYYRVIFFTGTPLKS